VDIQMDSIEAVAVMPVRSGWMLTWLMKMLSAVRFHQAGQFAGLRACREDTRELNVPVSLLKGSRPPKKRTDRTRWNITKSLHPHGQGIPDERGSKRLRVNFLGDLARRPPRQRRLPLLTRRADHRWTVHSPDSKA
jgi:hypothetical protein